MKKNSQKIHDMVYIALGAVLITICAWISIPIEIPFTLQTMGICLVCALLGGMRGTITVLIYLLLGIVGIPVFAGFTGGLGKIVSVTGGYIVGFLMMALVMWLVEKLLGNKLWALAIGMVLGLLVCYAFGSLWFFYLYTKGSNVISFAGVLGMCVVPYLIPDAIKIAVALLLVKIFREAFPTKFFSR